MPSRPDVAWAPCEHAPCCLPQASHELREMSLGISEQCNVSFASFWDLGPHVDPSDNMTEAAMLALADRALAFAAEGRLFNADATSTLLVASVSANPNPNPNPSPSPSPNPNPSPSPNPNPNPNPSPNPHQVSACGGTAVTMRCASDAHGYCAPITQLSQALKDYAARANGRTTGLRLQVLPPVDSAGLVVPHLPTTLPWPPGAGSAGCWLR